MNTDVCIVAVKYLEPEWEHTRRDIEACDVRTVFIDRDPPGIGNLAAAINCGFRVVDALIPNCKYVWFVTNVRFGPSAIPQLRDAIERTGYAAIHPAFDSDHYFLRKGAGVGCMTVPFVEFTAPFIRAEVFRKFPLDEKLPYVGHDLDWGYRVRQEGHVIAVDYDCTVEHRYNRHLAPYDRVTRQRAAARKQTNDTTLRRVEKLYGADWRNKLGYYGKL